MRQQALGIWIALERRQRIAVAAADENQGSNALRKMAVELERELNTHAVASKDRLIDSLVVENAVQVRSEDVQTELLVVIGRG